jgi:hypothetical protein
VLLVGIAALAVQLLDIGAVAHSERAVLGGAVGVDRSECSVSSKWRGCRSLNDINKGPLPVKLLNETAIFSLAYQADIM